MSGYCVAIASGESLRDWIRMNLDDPATLEQWQEAAGYESADDYGVEPLVADINSDIDLLRRMDATVDDRLAPESDPKLAALGETLVTVIAEAEKDTGLRAASRLDPDPQETAARDRDDRKILVFSYFADMISYLQDNPRPNPRQRSCAGGLQGPRRVRHRQCPQDPGARRARRQRRSGAGRLRVRAEDRRRC